MARLIEDIRYALRLMAKNRSFTAVAVLSLALGIGANTTVFTFINAIFLRPLPVERPETLVSLFTRDVKNPGLWLTSYPNFRDYRDQNQVFSSLVLHSSLALSITGAAEPAPVVGQIVSSNYFSALGVKMAAGRGFAREEDLVPGASPVAVVSHGLWTRRYGADPAICGKVIELNGWPYQIVGVAAPRFHGANALVQADVWVPSMMYPKLLPSAGFVQQRRALMFSVIGRLKPGVTMAQAQSAMQAISHSLERQFPRENQGRAAVLMPLTEGMISPNMRGNLTNGAAVLMTIAALVLLIACANLANLLLVRAAVRSREIAIRLALGASRARIIRQLLTESVLLSLTGAGAGILVARWARDVLWAVRPPMLASLEMPIEIDLRVLLFTLAAATLCGLFFGLAPALRATRPDLVSDLKDRAGQAAPTASVNARSLLVAGQVALSLVALIGASLFIRSLVFAQQIDPGFETGHIVLVQFHLSGQAYGEARGHEFQERLLESLPGIPGVVAVSLSSTAPFSGGIARTVLVEGEDNTGNASRTALTTAVTPGYLATMGITLVKGRDFSMLDRPNTPRVAIVNETMAARYFPGGAVGRRFRMVGEDAVYQVIGVARTANYLALGELPRPMVYRSMLQIWTPMSVLHARVTGDPEVALAAVRQAMQRRDANLLLDGSTMTSMLHNALWAPRLAAGLLSVFGGLALLLAIIGIYGLIAYSVDQRVREIGVRMALGAKARDVQWMVVRQALQLVVAGIVTGCSMALIASRYLQSLLFVVSPTDALTFVLVPTLLIVVAVAACWLPARRATRIDPLVALRYE